MPRRFSFEPQSANCRVPAANCAALLTPLCDNPAWSITRPSCCPSFFCFGTSLRPLQLLDSEQYRLNPSLQTTSTRSKRSQYFLGRPILPRWSTLRQPSRETNPFSPFTSQSCRQQRPTSRTSYFTFSHLNESIIVHESLQFTSTKHLAIPLGFHYHHVSRLAHALCTPAHHRSNGWSGYRGHGSWCPHHHWPRHVGHVVSTRPSHYIRSKHQRCGEGRPALPFVQAATTSQHATGTRSSGSEGRQPGCAPLGGGDGTASSAQAVAARDWIKGVILSLVFK